MTMRRPWLRMLSCAMLCAVPMAALAAGSSRPSPRPRVLPEQTFLQLELDVNSLTEQNPDAVTYGGSRDTDLLRQIAAATRASARAQVELLRQQNEVIRLLEELARRSPSK